MATASKIVSQAQYWVGCKESNGSHKKIIDVYNAHKPLARNYKVKYTDAWCATFVSAVAIKCKATGIIPTECSCEKMIALCKKKGIWLENESITPKVGDIVFYDWQDSGSGNNMGASDHVGIVEAVKGKDVYVIEGNYKNAVGRRIIKVNAKGLRGYARPKYEAEAKAPASPAKSVAVVAQEVIDGKWGVGDARKKKLAAAGYDYAAVQAKVNAILKGAAKSVDEVAREVLEGKWGNGEERKKKLTVAGYDYEAVQRRVNQLA